MCVCWVVIFRDVCAKLYQYDCNPFACFCSNSVIAGVPDAFLSRECSVVAHPHPISSFTDAHAFILRRARYITIISMQYLYVKNIHRNGLLSS